MPSGIGNAYAFQVFNTVSFSIVLGAPMLLYLKGLGASGTILGVAAALPPLLNILQMPAARFVETIGYRAFVQTAFRAAPFLRDFHVSVDLPHFFGALTLLGVLIGAMGSFVSIRRFLKI